MYLHGRALSALDSDRLFRPTLIDALVTGEAIQAASISYDSVLLLTTEGRILISGANSQGSLGVSGNQTSLNEVTLQYYSLTDRERVAFGSTLELKPGTWLDVPVFSDLDISTELDLTTMPARDLNLFEVTE